MFFRKADLPRMKETLAKLPDAARRWEETRRRTDPNRGIEFPPEGAEIQGGWSRVAGGMASQAARCGAIYQLTGDRAYAEGARRILLAWAKGFDRLDFRRCKDYLMPPESGTRAKEGGNIMGYYLVGGVLRDAALAYDCIHETLSGEDRQTLERDFFRKWVAAIEAYDHSRREPECAPDFMVAGGQWNGANMCNMGLAAVGFVLNDPRLYERAVKNFRLYLARDMLADGFYVEEDLLYAETCLSTLFTIAWMARSSGYGQDLLSLEVQAGPRESFDPRYYSTLPTCEGNSPARRSLFMFLDAQLDYQYPDFSPGNWGWTPGRGSLRNARQAIAMYNLAYGLTGAERYAFVLKNVTPGRASLDGAGLDLLCFGRPVEKAPAPDTRSRWYEHAKWIALKSIEGKAYWNSDSLYAFIPYGVERNKGVQPLTLDLFAFGKVLAPGTALTAYAQNLTKAYQGTEPAWNTVLVDGWTVSIFRGKADRAWMAYHGFGALAKVAAPRIHVRGERRETLYSPDVERHEEEDRTLGRTVAMTDTYVVDVFRVNYDRPPKYKHNFDYVLHGYGKLSLEGTKDNLAQAGDVTAVWKRDDGLGLRSTVLRAEPRGSTKFRKYTDAITDVLTATRGDFDERFLVVHEPVKGEPRIASITRLADETDAAAIEVRLKDGTVDRIALRTGPSKEIFSWKCADGKTLDLKGDYIFVRTRPDGTAREEAGVPSSK